VIKLRKQTCFSIPKKEVPRKPAIFQTKSSSYYYSLPIVDNGIQKEKQRNRIKYTYPDVYLQELIMKKYKYNRHCHNTKKQCTQSAAISN
jgi:hypothetical protein